MAGCLRVADTDGCADSLPAGLRRGRAVEAPREGGRVGQSADAGVLGGGVALGAGDVDARRDAGGREVVAGITAKDKALA